MVADTDWAELRARVRASVSLRVWVQAAAESRSSPGWAQYLWDAPKKKKLEETEDVGL